MHFSVWILTTGSPELAMEPFRRITSQDAGSFENVIFIETEEANRKSYQTDRVDLILDSQGGIRSYWPSISEWISELPEEYQGSENYGKAQAHFPYTTYKQKASGRVTYGLVLPKGWTLVTDEPVKNYLSYEVYLKDYLCEEKDVATDSYGYWYNPNAQWDKWVFGGRWPNAFKLVPGTSHPPLVQSELSIFERIEVEHGREKLEVIRPEGWAEGAYLDQIDWPGSVAETAQQALAFRETILEMDAKQDIKLLSVLDTEDLTDVAIQKLTKPYREATVAMGHWGLCHIAMCLSTTKEEYLDYILSELISPHCLLIVPPNGPPEWIGIVEWWTKNKGDYEQPSPYIYETMSMYRAWYAHVRAAIKEYSKLDGAAIYNVDCHI